MANVKYKIVDEYKGSGVGLWVPGLPKFVTLDATCDTKVLKYLYERKHPGITVVEPAASTEPKTKK